MAALVLSACLTAACGPSVASGTDPVDQASPIVSVPPTVSTTQGCDPATPSSQLRQGLEIQGVTQRAGSKLWALFDTHDGLVSQTDTRVWWRVSGDHALRVTLVGPNERMVSVNGSVPQPKANWTRPGEPWKSTITFPQSGCWRVFVQRGDTIGDFWVEVG